MRVRLLTVRMVRACMAAGLVFLPLASCFSERGAVVGPPTTEDCAVPLGAVGKGKAIVLIRDFNFYPDTLRVSAGTQVTWVNCERPATDFHTTTSDNGVWNSPGLVTGQTFVRAFAAGGSFPYHCTPHPTMKAVVIVQ